MAFGDLPFASAFFLFLAPIPLNLWLAHSLSVAKMNFELPTHEHSNYLFPIFLEYLNFR